MPVNDFTAAPTATTFHGVEISANMILAYSPHENSRFFAHIIKHQLTKFAPDFHLNDLHQALGIADMGQKYTEVIYPKILNALKARIRTLQSHKDKDYHPFAKAVVEDGRIRFYAKFMDAWAEPHWQGNMVKPPEQKNQVQEAPPPQPPTQPDPSITPQVPPVPLQPPNPAVQQTCPQASVAWSPFAQPPTSQPAPVIQHTSAQLGSSQQASLQSRVVQPSTRSPLVRSPLAHSHLAQRAPVVQHSPSQPPSVEPPSVQPSSVQLLVAQPSSTHSPLVEPRLFHSHLAQTGLVSQHTLSPPHPVQSPSVQQPFAEPRLFQSHLAHHLPPLDQTPPRQAGILPDLAQPHLQHKPSQHHSSFDNGPHTPPVSPSGHPAPARDFLSRARSPLIPPSPQSPNPGQLNAAGLQTSQSTSPELHHQSPPLVHPNSPWAQPLRRADRHQAATSSAPEDHHHVLFHRRHGCLQELLGLRMQALRLTADLTRNAHLGDYLSLLHQLDCVRDRRAHLLDIVVDTTRHLQAHGPAHVSFLAFRL